MQILFKYTQVNVICNMFLGRAIQKK